MNSSNPKKDMEGRSRLSLILFFGLPAIVLCAVFFYVNRNNHVLLNLSMSRPGTENLTEWARVGFDSEGDLGAWTVHHFSGIASASVVPDESGGFAMDIQSRGDATLYLHEADIGMEYRPHINWKWKVDEFPSGKSNGEFASKAESDFGARVYVVFAGISNYLSETIQYIWDDHFPEGTHRSIPLFPHLKMLVIRSGSDGSGEWHEETRDIFADYEMLFGKHPVRPLHAVGMMTDSDNTGKSAHAQYKDVRILIPTEIAESGVKPGRPKHGLAKYIPKPAFMKSVEDGFREIGKRGRTAFAELLKRARLPQIRKPAS